MKKTSPPIVFIKKDKLTVFQVKDEKIKKLAKGNWDQSNLESVFTKIIQSLKIKTIRVLLVDDLSQTLKVDIDKKTDNQRQAVKQKISDQIDTQSDWDYKITQEKINHLEATVFAPDKSFWGIFKKAIKVSHLHVEAVEPISVAKLRHDNPIIGLSLKKDLKGKDENVLNLDPEVSPQSLDYVDKSYQPKKSLKKFIFIGAVIILICLLIITQIIRSKTIAPTQNPSPSPELETLTSPSPEATASAQINLADYSIQVLNGSGVKGEAARVVETLKDAGFDSLSTGNADNYDYDDTEISLKDQTPLAVFEAIEKALEDTYTIVKDDDPLTDESAFDLVVIIGQKNDQ